MKPMMRRREFLLSSARCFGASAVTLAASPAWNRAFAAAPQAAPSSAIALNQVGYLPSLPKLASISARATSFVVRSTAHNDVVHRGTLGAPQQDATSGDTLQNADFSALTAPGDYIVELDSGQRSAPFRIASDVYRDALHLTTRAFYGQRCGCSVNLGNGYTHPACHLTAAYHASSGKTGPLHNHGGWHDAGDYGRYIVNSGISTGTLLWAWEFYHSTLNKLPLQIPESGGKTPDFLAEVRWNLDWMLTLQDEDGGVWHKQTSLNFCPIVMPQDDTLTSYVIGTGSAPYKSTCATADFAAVMAIAARCYSAFDAAYAQRCLAAARHAWTWCAANPDVPFKNPPGVATGEYGEDDCSDEMLWASAELWRTTGEADYLKAFISAAAKPGALKITAPDWGSLSSLAYWSYALASRSDAAGLRGAIQEATIQAAEALVTNSNNNGYGNTLSESDYVWGSNGVAGNQAMLLLIANHFHANSSFVTAALNNLHYLVGRNCFGISWVTQLGAYPFQHPHHRPSTADNLAEPWPGLLSGGPNRHPADPVARMLPPAPPMRMYIDDQGAYSVNEIAINWNAPLVFLLAAANSL
jgi:endoglucanase